MRLSRRVSVTVVAAATVLAIAIPALAADKSGTEAFHHCILVWEDSDSVGSPFSTDVHETGGDACVQVRAQIRVKENASWVTRQNTDAHNGFVKGYGATEFAWAHHDAEKHGIWYYDHVNH